MKAATFSDFSTTFLPKFHLFF